MATRPELHIAVAKTKSKASEYNANFTMMMDYCEAVSTEAKDYVDTTLEGNVFYRILGETIFSLIPLSDSSVHLLDGSIINGSGIYKDFVDSIVALAEDYPHCFCTEAQWQQSISDYGVCGKYVYDSVNNTVRLPKLGNQLIHNIPSTLGVKGNGMALGFQAKLNSSDTMLTNFGLSDGGSDLIARTTAYGQSVGDSHSGGDNPVNQTAIGVTTDPTKSGIVAETNNINTADVYYYVVIATSTKTDIEVDIDEIATDLNGKADVDLSNINPTQTVKNTIVGWGMPDWSRAVSKTANTVYTSTQRGWVQAAGHTIQDGVHVYINGYRVASCEATGGQDESAFGCLVPVGVGDVYKLTNEGNGGTVDSFNFIPCKGEA